MIKNVKRKWTQAKHKKMLENITKENIEKYNIQGKNVKSCVEN